ncbi:MAG: hypothetical protein WC858_00680 [Parcubacteria group bacterium]|jgi:hypothetical protein
MKTKMITYIFLVIILTELLSMLGYGLLEMKFIVIMYGRNLPIQEEHIMGIFYTALPVRIFWSFLLFGIILGYLLGKSWWRIVYVERRHWNFKQIRGMK